MKRSETWRADALDNYWDAVQRDDEVKRVAELDEASALIVAFLSQRPASLDAQPVQQRIRQELMKAAKQLEGQNQIEGVRFQPPNASTMGIESIHASKNRWLHSTHLGRVAVALVVAVLVIVASLGILSVRDEPTESPAVIPAAFVLPATPTILEGAPVLFSFTIPEEQLPAVDVAGSGFTYWTIPVGNSAQWEATCCPGPLLQYVVEGSYTVTFDSEFQLFRAGGTVEFIPANDEVTLSSGDAVIAQNDDVMTASNAGSSPLEILQWNLIDDDSGAFSGRPVPGWNMTSRDVLGPTLFPSPVDVRMVLVTVPAESRLTPAADSYLFASTSLRNPAGSPEVTSAYVKLGDGSIANSSNRTVTLYVLTMHQAHPAPSVPLPWR